MDSGLIYDIGAHKGEDTAYYLHLGFRVVAVEANPELAEALRRRFAGEIASGRLTLEEVGIAERAGEATFWICNEQTVWSSFNEGKAAWGGATNRPVTVRTQPFADLLLRYGVPYYCKIDIEGNDRLCLDGIDPGDRPHFLSIEMGHTGGDNDLRKLHDLGYRRFKIVNQRTFRPAWVPAIRASELLPDLLRKFVHRIEEQAIGYRKDGHWSFPRGSSGPFGDHLPGRWISLDQALALWCSLRDVEQRKRTGDWFDIHAVH